MQGPEGRLERSGLVHNWVRQSSWISGMPKEVVRIGTRRNQMAVFTLENAAGQGELDAVLCMSVFSTKERLQKV